MKTLRISLAVATVAVASVGAMSFTSKAETKVKSGDDPVYIWLDENGNDLGQRTYDQQDELCGPIKQQFCADGYMIDEETGEPTGSPVHTLLKAND